MSKQSNRRPLVALALALCAGAALAASPQSQSFRFRTGVELINVTATVTDASGRFVPGLRKEDFRVFEDGVEQPITHFDNERVPVSLGIVLDTSGSMAGEKIAAARRALDRFLFDLLDRRDEVFLYRFDNRPELVSDWTNDRGRVSGELGRIVPRGGTAMYDTLYEAAPLAQSGRNRKKAIVLISDGNDTSSSVDVMELKQRIRETEVLVYAVGIDSSDTPYRSRVGGQRTPPPRVPIPLPFPIPGRRPTPPPQPYPPTGGTVRGGSDDRVNVAALRDITDDSGGRTEIVRFAQDLDPATAGIADELSRQYYLGYPATGRKDGQWHSIRVEVRSQQYRVRARRGYMAAATGRSTTGEAGK
jgi:Ca-activated chloride channel family protein